MPADWLERADGFTLVQLFFASPNDPAERTAVELREELAVRLASEAGDTLVLTDDESARMRESHRRSSQFVDPTYGCPACPDESPPPPSPSPSPLVPPPSEPPPVPSRPPLPSPPPSYCLTLLLQDSFSDGWSANVRLEMVPISGAALGIEHPRTFTLEYGAEAQHSVCIGTTGCFALELGEEGNSGGRGDGESSWMLRGCGSANNRIYEHGEAARFCLTAAEGVDEAPPQSSVSCAILFAPSVPPPSPLLPPPEPPRARAPPPGAPQEAPDAYNVSVYTVHLTTSASATLADAAIVQQVRTQLMLLVPQCTAPLCLLVVDVLPCAAAPAAVCAGSAEPCVFDAACDDPHSPDHAGGLGCNAGGVGQACRFCGFGAFLSCPSIGLLSGRRRHLAQGARIVVASYTIFEYATQSNATQKHELSRLVAAFSSLSPAQMSQEMALPISAVAVYAAAPSVVNASTLYQPPSPLTVQMPTSPPAVSSGVPQVPASKPLAPPPHSPHPWQPLPSAPSPVTPPFLPPLQLSPSRSPSAPHLLSYHSQPQLPPLTPSPVPLLPPAQPLAPSLEMQDSGSGVSLAFRNEEPQQPPTLPPSSPDSAAFVCTTSAAAVCGGPTEPCFYDPACADTTSPDHHGGLGCNAGGLGLLCRFCGFRHFLNCPHARSAPPPASPAPQSTALLADEASALSALEKELATEELALRLLVSVIFGGSIFVSCIYCCVVQHKARQLRRREKRLKAAQDEKQQHLLKAFCAGADVFSDVSRWSYSHTAVSSRAVSHALREASRDASSQASDSEASQLPEPSEVSERSTRSVRRRAASRLFSRSRGLSSGSLIAPGDAEEQRQEEVTPVPLIRWKDITVSGKPEGTVDTKSAAIEKDEGPLSQDDFPIEKSGEFGEYKIKRHRFPRQQLMVLATGDTYVATVKAMKRVYMLHSIELSVTQDALRRVLLEAAELRKLQHSSLLHIFAVVADQPYGEVGLLSELTTASLASVLDKPGDVALSWQNGLLAIATDVASGLAYLHARGHHHGRLFLFNVLLTSKWRAKLAEAALEPYLNASHGGLGDIGGYDLLPSAHGEHSAQIKASSVLYLPPEKCSGQVAVAQRKRMQLVKVAEQNAKAATFCKVAAAQGTAPIRRRSLSRRRSSGRIDELSHRQSSGRIDTESIRSCSEGALEDDSSVGCTKVDASPVAPPKRRRSVARRPTKERAGGVQNKAVDDAFAEFEATEKEHSAATTIQASSRGRMARQRTRSLRSFSLIAASASGSRGDQMPQLSEQLEAIRLAEEAKAAAELAEQRGDAWAFGCLLCSLALHQKRQRDREKAERLARFGTGKAFSQTTLDALRERRKTRQTSGFADCAADGGRRSSGSKAAALREESCKRREAMREASRGLVRERSTSRRHHRRDHVDLEGWDEGETHDKEGPGRSVHRGSGRHKVSAASSSAGHCPRDMCEAAAVAAQMHQAKQAAQHSSGIKHRCGTMLHRLSERMSMRSSTVDEDPGGDGSSSARASTAEPPAALKRQGTADQLRPGSANGREEGGQTRLANRRDLKKQPLTRNSRCDTEDVEGLDEPDKEGQGKDRVARPLVRQESRSKLGAHPKKQESKRHWIAARPMQPFAKSTWAKGAPTLPPEQVDGAAMGASMSAVLGAQLGAQMEQPPSAPPSPGAEEIEVVQPDSTEPLEQQPSPSATASDSRPAGRSLPRAGKMCGTNTYRRLAAAAVKKECGSVASNSLQRALASKDNARTSSVIAALTGGCTATGRLTNFEDTANANATSSYVLMLRVCQGLVSPLDGVTHAACPKQLFHIASRCCELRPEARPDLSAVLKQLEDQILKAIDPSAIAGARRPTETLKGWRDTAEEQLRKQEAASAAGSDDGPSQAWKDACRAAYCASLKPAGRSQARRDSQSGPGRADFVGAQSMPAPIASHSLPAPANRARLGSLIGAPRGRAQASTESTGGETSKVSLGSLGAGARASLRMRLAFKLGGAAGLEAAASSTPTPAASPPAAPADDRWSREGIKRQLSKKANDGEDAFLSA